MAATDRDLFFADFLGFVKGHDDGCGAVPTVIGVGVGVEDSFSVLSLLLLVFLDCLVFFYCH